MSLVPVFMCSEAVEYGSLSFLTVASTQSYAVVFSSNMLSYLYCRNERIMMISDNYCLLPFNWSIMKHLQRLFG